MTGVAAALAVLAGVAASDAACCAAVKFRPRGQAHREAVKVVEAISLEGPAMAKELERLLSAKDQAHYGLHALPKPKALPLLAAASRLVDLASAVVARYP